MAGVEKKMDHTEYMAKVKTMSFESLLYVAKDAKQAMEALPDGVNAGYYADECHYVNMEMNRRREASLKDLRNRTT